MLGAEIHIQGDTEWVGKILARTDSVILERNVFGPFIRWILGWRIPELYRRRGVVGGEGVPWPALSKWTLASKGVQKFGEDSAAPGVSSLLPLVSGSLHMLRSFMVTHVKTGPMEWLLTLRNIARSTSRWSPGFDYPSALHRGWGPYTVKPRAGGPGVLMWPLRYGTVIGASMGRRETEGSLLRSGTVSVLQKKGKHGKYSFVYGKPKAKNLMVTSEMMIAMETHPKGAPPRPHIMFLESDARKLGAATCRYVLFGESPQQESAVSVGV